MVEIGQFNKLKVVKTVPFGVYLDGAELGEILLPKKYVPQGTEINDTLTVFLYFDSEDKIIATTLQPRAIIGGFAFLKVVDVSHMGAFLDWGLDKDLFVPVPEQKRSMELGKSYLVYLKKDSKERIMASSKIDYYLDKTPPMYNTGDEVNLMIAESTALGRKAIVNGLHWGLIHTTDLFQTVYYGQKLKGYIKAVREDDKIDLLLRKPGQAGIRGLAARVLEALNNNDGFLPLHDKTPSEEIKIFFGESKKSFKSAIGQLYKQGLVDIKMDGIRIRNI